MNRQLRDDLVETGIEPQAAVVLASVIPDIEQPLAELGETMDRGFARQRNLMLGSTVLILATLAVSKILGTG